MSTMMATNDQFEAVSAFPTLTQTAGVVCGAQRWLLAPASSAQRERGASGSDFFFPWKIWIYSWQKDTILAKKSDFGQHRAGQWSTVLSLDLSFFSHCQLLQEARCAVERCKICHTCNFQIAKKACTCNGYINARGQGECRTAYKVILICEFSSHVWTFENWQIGKKIFFIWSDVQGSIFCFVDDNDCEDGIKCNFKYPGNWDFSQFWPTIENEEKVVREAATGVFLPGLHQLSVQTVQNQDWKAMPLPFLVSRFISPRAPLKTLAWYFEVP